MSSNVPVVIRLEIRDVFQTVFLVSQREHCIFQKGVVSYSSPQRRHIGSFPIFSKVKCRPTKVNMPLSVLCPVRRPTKIFKSFRDNPTAYFANLVLLFCRIACRQLWILFHFLFCSWTDHWLTVFLTLVTEGPNTGSGTVKSVVAACFAKLSAISKRNGRQFCKTGFNVTVPRIPQQSDTVMNRQTL